MGEEEEEEEKNNFDHRANSQFLTLRSIGEDLSSSNYVPAHDRNSLNLCSFTLMFDINFSLRSHPGFCFGRGQIAGLVLVNFLTTIIIRM